MFSRSCSFLVGHDIQTFEYVAKETFTKDVKTEVLKVGRAERGVKNFSQSFLKSFHIFHHTHSASCSPHSFSDLSIKSINHEIGFFFFNFRGFVVLLFSSVKDTWDSPSRFFPSIIFLFIRLWKFIGANVRQKKLALQSYQKRKKFDFHSGDCKKKFTIKNEIKSGGDVVAQGDEKDSSGSTVAESHEKIRKIVFYLWKINLWSTESFPRLW